MRIVQLQPVRNYSGQTFNVLICPELYENQVGKLYETYVRPITFYVRFGIETTYHCRIPHFVRLVNEVLDRAISYGHGKCGSSTIVIILLCGNGIMWIKMCIYIQM